MSTIKKVFKIAGVPANMTSVVFSDPSGSYGVKRNDTGAVVVADGTALTNTGVGVYEYTFADPANDLTYTYYIEFVYNGQTFRISGSLTGPASVPAITGTPRYQIRQSIGASMGGQETVMVTGVPRGPLLNISFLCEALKLEEDDYYNDWYGRFYAGTHIGTNFRVRDFAAYNGLVVFSPSVTSEVDTTDLFELHRDFSPSEIDRKINESIIMVQDEALEDMADDTVEIVEGTYEYVVPPGFAFIDEIIQGNADDEFPENGRIDRRWYQIISKSGTKYIRFNDQTVSLADGCKLRIIGQTKPSLLNTDSATTNINYAWIVQQAKALLHQSRVDGSSGISERHDAQYQIAQANADRLRSRIQVAPRGWKV